jgi:Na+/melibiose symporter-like transporter
MIFQAMTPLAIVDLVLVCLFLRNVGDPHQIGLDLPSVVLSTLGFGSLLYGFSAAGSLGWGNPLVILPIILGTIIIALFARRQLKLDEPLLELRVFLSPVFSWAVLLSVICNLSLIASSVIFPIFVQNGLGYNALMTGLLAMPGAILMGIVSPFVGLFFDRFGPRKLVLTGFACSTVAYSMLALSSANSSFLFLSFSFVIKYFGLALVNMPLLSWGVNALESRYLAHGTAVNNTARQVAAAIFTALIITIMSLIMTAHSGDGTVQATIIGSKVAFGIAGALNVVALIIAFLKVRTLG